MEVPWYLWMSIKAGWLVYLYRRFVQGSTRVMPVCLTTGEAVGTASAIAAAEVAGALRAANVHAVSIGKLRSQLNVHRAY